MVIMDEKLKTICFDYSHNNALKFESPVYPDFLQFLFDSGYRLGKIEAGFDNIEKLSRYKILIIGGPVNSKFTPKEIEVIEQFVKNGGALLLISDGGGDEQSDSNLNDLAKIFGFTFENTVLYDSVKNIEKQNRVIIDTFEPHVITHNISHIVHSSGGTIAIDETIGSDENIKVEAIALSGLNSFIFEWDEEENQNIEKEYPKKPILVASYYYKGRVVGIANLSLFSSINPTYGFEALDNKVLISNIFLWLSENKEAGELSETRMVTLELNTNLMLWMEKLVHEKEWNNLSDIINFAIKYLKDNYSSVLSEVEKQRQKLKAERVRKMLEEENKLAMKNQPKTMGFGLRSAEEKILGLKDKDEQTAKAFNDLMGILSKLTDGELGNVRAEDIQRKDQEVETKIKDLEENLKTVESVIAVETIKQEENKQVLELAKKDEEENLKRIKEEAERLKQEEEKAKKELEELEKKKNEMKEEDLSKKQEELQGKSQILKVKMDILTQQEEIAKNTLEKLEQQKKLAETNIEKIKSTQEKISELKTTESEEEPLALAKKPRKFEDFQIEEQLKLKIDTSVGIFAEKQIEVSKPEIKLTDTKNVDDDIEKALSAMVNMEEFSKKIEQFKTIVGKKEDKTKAKKQEKVDDDEYFVE